jgi:hypothetical protein
MKTFPPSILARLHKARPATHPADPAQPVLVKGEKNGLCNRTACQQPGATWHNKYNGQYYCASCAHLINYQERVCTNEAEEISE